MKKGVFFSIIALILVFMFVLNFRVISKLDINDNDIALTQTKVRILNNFVNDLEERYFEKVLEISSYEALRSLSLYSIAGETPELDLSKDDNDFYPAVMWMRIGSGMTGDGENDFEDDCKEADDCGLIFDDYDNDGISDDKDNCPAIFNPKQEKSFNNQEVGRACDCKELDSSYADNDEDGVCENTGRPKCTEENTKRSDMTCEDNCPGYKNPFQFQGSSSRTGENTGDACNGDTTNLDNDKYRDLGTVLSTNNPNNQDKSLIYLMRQIQKTANDIGLNVNELDVKIVDLRQEDHFNVIVNAKFKYYFTDADGSASWRGNVEKEVKVDIMGIEVPLYNDAVTGQPSSPIEKGEIDDVNWGIETNLEKKIPCFLERILGRTGNYHKQISSSSQTLTDCGICDNAGGECDTICTATHTCLTPTSTPTYTDGIGCICQ